MNGLVHIGACTTRLVATYLNTPSQKVFTDLMVIVSRIVAVYSNGTNFAKKIRFFYGIVITTHTNNLNLNKKDSLFTVNFPVNNFGAALERETNFL